MNKHQHSAFTTSRASGFTLIELLVAVAVMSILAMVATPIYTQHLVRANRAAAEACLVDIAQQQQQYLLDARSYAASVSQLNVSVPVNVSSNYTIAITTGSAPPSFVASATPIAGTRQATDVTLSIDNAGLKSPAAVW